MTKKDRDDTKINRPPILFKKTQKLIAEIEKRIDGSFLAYWNSGKGAVCHNDVAAFYEVLKHIGKTKRLFFFVKSSGGNGQAALRIVNLIRQYADSVINLVPLECASAATMISLGADEIRMGPLAYLTAVDTSLTHDLSPIDKNNYLVSVSQDELIRVIKLWQREGKETDENPYKALYQHIHPLVFGAIDRSSSLSIKICDEILAYHISDPKVRKKISRALNEDYPSHSYPITLREARTIGLKVDALDPELNDLLLDLNELYSEMGQRALTDFDEENYHDNEIVNIIEGKGVAFNYQNDKDWHYRKEERRWVPMNDQSVWHRYENGAGTKLKHSQFHIR